jgi:lipopolysaccharide heptosyltransferase III
MSACKIIIVQLGRIGDTVLMTPMINALAAEVTDAEIYLLVSRNGKPVVQNDPNVKRIYVFKKTPLTLFRLFWDLTWKHFDYWIDPKDHFSRESAMLVKYGRARIKVGFNRKKKPAFNIGIPSDKENIEKHLVERNLQVLQQVELISSMNYHLQLFPDEALQKEIEEELDPWDVPNVLLNISAGHTSRYWEISKWKAVADFCLSRHCRVIVVFKPKDHQLAQSLEGEKVICFPTSSIRKIIALMPNIQLVITPDTSIVHIAAAFNIPQIALFPAIQWNLDKFRPLSEKSIIIQPAEGLLIKTIDKEEVIAAIAKILK